MTRQARALSLLGAVLASAGLWWRPITADLHLALTSEAYTYILLVIPLSLTLIYLGRRESHLNGGPGRHIGSILLVAALLLRLLTGWNVFRWSASGNLTLSVAALVVFWIGAVIVCFDITTLKTHLFALSFLFLIVPLPDQALTWVTRFLQQESAWAASILFRAAGVPVAREGVLLFIPGLDIEVARECSSIRSSTILIVITLILAHLFLQTSSRKTLLILAAIPLSVAKNAVRIFTIAELGTRVDRGFLDGRLHHKGGVIFLGVGVIATVLLLWVLRYTEFRKTKTLP